MAWSAAAHTVKYAVERFGIEDLIDTSDWVGCKKSVNCPAVFDDMYHFLNWKLGSPTLVAVHWLTHGYRHFDKAYSDEAAAFLVGLLSIRDMQPTFVVPEWLQDYIAVQVGQATAAGIAALLVSWGLDPGTAAAIGEQVAGLLGNVIPFEIFVPNRFDIDNKLVEEAIVALRRTETGPSDPLQSAGGLVALEIHPRLQVVPRTSGLHPSRAWSTE